MGWAQSPRRGRFCGVGCWERRLPRPTNAPPAARARAHTHTHTHTQTPPPHPPGIPIDGKTVFTSDHALKLEWLPQWIAIIGSGYIGLEFSDVYTALGCEVGGRIYCVRGVCVCVCVCVCVRGCVHVCVRGRDTGGGRAGRGFSRNRRSAPGEFWQPRAPAPRPASLLVIRRRRRRIPNPPPGDVCRGDAQHHAGLRQGDRAARRARAHQAAPDRLPHRRDRVQGHARRARCVRRAARGARGRAAVGARACVRGDGREKPRLCPPTDALEHACTHTRDTRNTHTQHAHAHTHTRCLS
jgi:hypothetical protein